MVGLAETLHSADRTGDDDAPLVLAPVRAVRGRCGKKRITGTNDEPEKQDTDDVNQPDHVRPPFGLLRPRVKGLTATMEDIGRQCLAGRASRLDENKTPVRREETSASAKESAELLLFLISLNAE